MALMYLLFSSHRLSQRSQVCERLVLLWFAVGIDNTVQFVGLFERKKG